MVVVDIRRQWVVPLCIGLLVLGVGGGSVAYDRLDAPSPAEQPPTKPSTLTNDSVAEYVTAYERRHLHGVLDQRGAETDVRCEGSVDARSNGGFFAVTVCDATSDRGSSVFDLRRVTAAYFVNATTTERVGRYGATAVRTYQRDRLFPAGSDEAPAGSDEATDAADRGSASLRVYNFDSTTANVTVSLAGPGSADAPPPTSVEYSIPAATGVVETDYSVRRGTYRVGVESGTGGTVTRDWTVGEPPSPALVVYVAPDGDLVASVPDREPRSG